MSICWHKWGKWSKLINAYDGVYQYSTCDKCNRLRKRRRGLSVAFSLTSWNTDSQEGSEKGSSK